MKINIPISMRYMILGRVLSWKVVMSYYDSIIYDLIYYALIFWYSLILCVNGPREPEELIPREIECPLVIATHEVPNPTPAISGILKLLLTSQYWRLLQFGVPKSLPPVDRSLWRCGRLIRTSAQWRGHLRPYMALQFGINVFGKEIL